MGKKSLKADLLDIDEIIVDFLNIAKKNKEGNFLQKKPVVWKIQKIHSEVGFSESNKKSSRQTNQQLIFFSPVAILSQGHGSSLYCSIAPWKI